MQIAYPLTGGRARRNLSVGTVLVAAGATVLHEVGRSGLRTAVLSTAVAGGGSFAVEALGVRTGVPFGRYSYSPRLGRRVAGVPLVVPCAWVMMAGPALAAARRLAAARGMVTAVGALAFASWDVFLDPQMVADGNWEWHTKSFALQGIPLVNYLGWILVAGLLTNVLERVVPRGVGPEADDTVPLVLYLWNYAGSVVANAVFLRRPGVALSGGVAMGTVALPLARRILGPR